MEALSTETFKIALFYLIIDTVKYSRDKWLAGKQQSAGVNERAKTSLGCYSQSTTEPVVTIVSQPHRKLTYSLSPSFSAQ
jgi:hypothetical protein